MRHMELLSKGTLLRRMPDPLDASLGDWAQSVVEVEQDSCSRHVLVRHVETGKMALVSRSRFTVVRLD